MEIKRLFSVVYRPPSSDVTHFQELIRILEEIVISNPTTPIWIGGDMNLPNINWNNNE